MRENINNLFILSGPPASGKSTFINNNQLAPYTLSLDAIRMLVSTPSLYSNGKMRINNGATADAVGLQNQLLEKKMADGGPIVIDRTSLEVDDIVRLCDLAKSYHYKPFLVRSETLPISQLLERDSNRPEFAQVGRVVLEKMKRHEANLDKSIISGELFSKADNLRVIGQGQVLEILNASVDSMTVSLDGVYDDVKIIGDIQGCADVLSEAVGEFSPKTMYVFVGDYLDRGIQNGEVVKIMAKLATKPNTVLLRGNHESHIMNYVSGRTPKSAIFVNKTLPDLKNTYKDDDLLMDDLKTICASLRDFYAFQIADKKFFINHGGLSVIPAQPMRMSGFLFSKGQGYYGVRVDEAFEDMEHRKENAGWYQAHGHRNTSRRYSYKKESGQKSFPLEQSVEFGGYLPVLRVDKKGEIKQINYKNRTYAVQPGFTEQSKQEVAKLIEDMRGHSLVTEHKIGDEEIGQNVISFAFKKEAFFKKIFNDKEVCMARGLFLNEKTLSVVARSYDKFFTYKEPNMPGVTDEEIAQKFSFPVHCAIKENGYLGIVGYDDESDSLVIRGKSGIKGPFSQRFKELLLSKVDEQTLKHFLIKNNVTLTFEVIDPVFDPHIIEYQEADVILLDVIHRSIEYRKIPYADVAASASVLGVKTNKANTFSFKSLDNMFGFINRVNQTSPIDPSVKDKYKSEGFIIEDDNGNVIKLKTPYYNMWKNMRSAKGTLAVRFIKEMEARANSAGGVVNGSAIDVLGKEYIEEHISAYIENKAYAVKEMADDVKQYCRDFLMFALKDPLRAKETGIIALRTEFENHLKSTLEQEQSPTPPKPVRPL